MPDHPVTPTAFREALDEFGYAYYRYEGGLEVDEARDRVLALYAARLGDEYTVEQHVTVGLDGWFGANCVWLGREFAPGDRVFVTKGEAG